MNSATPSSPTGQRNVLIKKNILAGFVLKGWSALTILLTVPLTLNCLGSYQNGIWLTISSILVWIDMLDIGLGNGLRNQLTIDLAHNDMQRARQTVSSTLAMLATIVGIALIVIIGMISYFDVYRFLNVDQSAVDNLPQMLTMAVILVCITFVLKFVGNVYMSFQLPAVNNLLITLGQTLALLGTYLLFRSGQATLLWVIIVNTASPLLVYLAAYPYTFCARYPALLPAWRCINLSVARSMMNLGVKFFALQLASLILFLSSNLMISRLYSPDMVNPYQITYRYFSLVLILFTVICMPYWSATTDAYTRKDIDWIKRANHRMTTILIALIGLLAIMVLFSSIVYTIWIGESVSIPSTLSVAMACYIAILISSMRYSYFLNGIGALRLQLIIAICAAVIFIPLAWGMAQWHNSLTGFVIVLCLVNIPGLIINCIQFNRIIAGKATGIWKE